MMRIAMLLLLCLSLVIGAGQGVAAMPAHHAPASSADAGARLPAGEVATAAMASHAHCDPDAMVGAGQPSAPSLPDHDEDGGCCQQSTCDCNCMNCLSALPLALDWQLSTEKGGTLMRATSSQRTAPPLLQPTRPPIA